MELSSDQMKMLEEAGKALLDFRQSAIIIEVDDLWLKSELENQNSKAHKSYYKGYFISMIKVRKSIISLAERGSFPAQQLLQKIMEKQ